MLFLSRRIILSSAGFLLVSFLLAPLNNVLALSTTATKVAVIGATGRLGRETVQQLSKQGIPTRCLLRHDVSSITPPASLQDAESSAQVAASLSTLPGVEMVQGDINDAESLQRLLDGCTACLALHGPSAPKPFVRALVFPALLYPESNPTHPKQLNYVGIQKLISAVEASQTCQRLVRVTGKGEDPWGFFSILINALGGLAKGWNYEGEQLLRKSAVDYTIIRPGIMKDAIEEEGPVLGLADNGQDMNVTAVSYQQIADLMVQSLSYPNCRRATLTAMNVPEGEASYAPLLEKVQSDSRDFPDSLLSEHRRAARVGGLAMIAFGVLGLQFVARVFLAGVGMLRRLL